MDKLTINKTISKSQQKNFIQVAVGVVTNSEGQILVAKRPDHWLGGGFWEFPGGKIEVNEDPKTALKRELLEEVGIVVEECTPLIKLIYDYPERTIMLHAWRVTLFSGQASGLEGQEIGWQTPQSLNEMNMLPANRAIVVATQLPETYLVAPDYENHSAFLRDLSLTLSSYPHKLLQFRAKTKSKLDYIYLAREVLSLCHEKAIRLILSHEDLSVMSSVDADGIQLTSWQISALNERPLPRGKWVAASCRHHHEIVKAEAIGADFLVVGPVHSALERSSPMGWHAFKELVSLANLPVYAWGGLHVKDLVMAKCCGAQGIAATRTFWVRD
jgi:8-oxo-dGTP diphosphatase